MFKTLIAAGLVAATLAAPAAQAGDARLQFTSGPTFSAEIQIGGGHHWGGGRHWGGGHHWGGPRFERLRPRQIVRRLERRGFYDVHNLRPRGDVYVARARGPRGVPQRLVIDAYSGEIIGRTVIGPHHW